MYFASCYKHPVIVPALHVLLHLLLSHFCAFASCFSHSLVSFSALHFLPYTFRFTHAVVTSVKEGSDWAEIVAAEGVKKKILERNCEAGSVTNGISYFVCIWF